MIDNVFVDVASAEMIILDLRGNEGGTDTLGEQLARHLLAPGFTYFSLATRHSELQARSVLSTMKLRAQRGNIPGLTAAQVETFRTVDPESADPQAFGFPTERWSDRVPYVPDSRSAIAPFSGRVILLIDAECFSTCDNVVACIQDQHPDVVTMGEGTGGGTGAPTPLKLPHTGTGVRFCIMKVYRPSGGLIEGIGSEPDVALTPTPRDWTAQRDVVLETALQLAGRA